MLSFPPFNRLRPLIQPDYTKSVAKVFEEATARVIATEQNLGLLSSQEHGSKIDHEWGPSWVPRWDRGRTTQLLHRYTSGQVESDKSRMRCSPGVLLVDGVRISTILWRGEVIKKQKVAVPGMSEVDTFRQPFLEWLLRVLVRIMLPIDDLLLAIAMTVAVGFDITWNCPPKDTVQLRLDLLAYIADLLPHLSLPPKTLQLLEERVEQAPPGNAQRFRVLAGRGCKNRRLFCMHDGTFGVGPRAAEPGDIIALVYGSCAPYVLGRGARCSTFVGECFVYDHMHGEALKMVSGGSYELEQFEIR
jgi:hypothetical protein